MNDGLLEKHLVIIHEILAPHQAITHALLFGSRARGAFKPTSDVDIALKGAITIRLIAKIKAEFEESNLPFFVDIVDYARADNALKSEIDTQGVLLYVKDISSFSNIRAIHKDCTLTSKDDKSSPCHSERSEESDRDISLVSQAQYDKASLTCHSDLECNEREESQYIPIALTQNQIAFSKYPAFTYILTNKNNTTLYIGVTSNMQKRIYEHKNHLAKGFSDKYNCEKLVYFESFDNINQAIEREKYLKGKKRKFKENLIRSINPKWLDLYDYLFRDTSALLQYDNTPCHSEPALAGEESIDMKSHRDISLTLNMTSSGVCHTDLDLCHSEFPFCHSKPSFCHSEPLSCHSERSEESNRDISLVSQAQYDNKGRK